jgi:peroxiredoxin (alkyl hydroperoxide reductase subunit C)
MKKMLLLVLSIFTVTQLWSQNAKTSSETVKEERNFRMPLIGETAPSFTAESTNGTVAFPTAFGRKWKLLFSHPQDFTPVCTTEIIELARLQEEMNKMGVKLVVVSTDPLATHVQWKKSMEELSTKNNESVKIKFPLVDDEKLKISKQYGMIHPLSNSTRAVRGVFIIDPDNVIQAIYFYPASVGRNTEELIRMVTALQVTASEKLFTPVNWKAGNDLIAPVPPTIDGKVVGYDVDKYYSEAWYLWYKKADNKPKGRSAE